MAKTIKINNDTILYITLFCVISLILLRDVFAFSFNNLILSFLCIIAMLFLNYDNLISLILFLIPLMSGISSGIILSFAIIVILFKRKKFKIIEIVMSLIVVTLELIACNWYTKVDYLELLNYFATSIVLFLFIFRIEKFDYKKVLNYYLLGTFIAVSISLLGAFSNEGFNITNILSHNFRAHIGTNKISPDGHNLIFNANTFAFYCISGISISLVLSHISRKKWKYLFLVFYLTIVGSISLSRTFIIVLLLICFCYCFVGKNFNTKMIKLFSLFMIGALFFIVLQFSDSYVIQSILNRFKGDDISTLGKRTILFKEYFSLMKPTSRFFWLGTGVIEYATVTNIFNSIHNATQQIIVCLGIPFGIVYLAVLLKPAFKCLKEKIGFIYWIPFISVILFLQSIQFLNPSMFMLSYIPVLYSLRLGKQKF